VHKIKVVLKELRETRFWVRYIIRTELLPGLKMVEIADECNQLCNIFGKSTVTAKGINTRAAKKNEKV
jgi:hypothetical protein